MSVTNPERVVTKQDLADFYDELLPFISPKSYAGFTPIGTIIPMIAESAPANYLICNGATYNKSDYPELAAHLLSMTSHSMYEVSGDNTKFKVPDLRGEFIRGTGTNGHSGEGDGSAVGVHQGATQIPYFTVGTDNTINFPVGSENNQLRAYESAMASVAQKRVTGTNAGWNAAERVRVRPTNTSVLFCIAVKNIYLDPKNDYSTDEKVVGTWIDGKTLYQRTFTELTMPVVDTDNVAVSKIFNFSDLGIATGSLDFMEVVDGAVDGAQVNTCWGATSGGVTTIYFFRVICGASENKIVAQTNRSSLSEKTFWVTLRYTKTT